MIAITALTHVQAHLFICGEHRGMETSYSSLKTQNKNQNKKNKPKLTQANNTEPHPPEQLQHGLYIRMTREHGYT